MPGRLRLNISRRTSIATRVRQFRGVQGAPVQEVADDRQLADEFQRELDRLKFHLRSDCRETSRKIGKAMSCRVRDASEILSRILDRDTEAVGRGFMKCVSSIVAGC